MQLAFTTADELFALLEQAGEVLDYREVWPHLFPITNCPPELMHTLMGDLVHNDERFTWEGDLHVGLTQWRAQRHDLADVVFTVVDLETTGSTPGFAKITEIGAVRVAGGRQVATFSQLVNPRQTIPAIITSITGIDDEMVADAPPIQVALPRFVEFAADSVLVAHNARFDLGFLDYELGILQRCTFPRPALDTLRLARRLYPHTRCSLANLAARFDTAVKPKHRALADAQATAELLLIFLARLQEEGVTTLEEVARFCEPGARRNYHKIVLTEGLPTAPGVYIMRDERGHALYIGKAENLRRRTRDHFLQRQAYGARQALELLAEFEIVETGSEFAALLLEERLIAKHRPMYNLHGTRVSSYHYVKLTADEYPRLYATPNLRQDGSVYAGPFRKASLARRLTDCLNAVHPLRTCVRLPKAQASPDVASGEGHGHRDGNGGGNGGGRAQHACPRADTGGCLAPCREKLNGQYSVVVEQVRRVLEGHGDELDELLQTRQNQMVHALAFEQAAKLQGHRETLAGAMRVVRRLRAALADYAVLVYPAKAAGKVSLWGVAAGAVVVERDIRPAAFSHSDAAALIAELSAVVPPQPPLAAAAIDEILLVHNWLQRHREAANVLDLTGLVGAAAGRGQAAAADELLARIRLCLTTSADE